MSAIASATFNDVPPDAAWQNSDALPLKILIIHFKSKRLSKSFIAILTPSLASKFLCYR
jgi:hypothetical protein